MATVVGIRFKTATKTYYFDPKGEIYKVGEKVIAETARGLEFATIFQSNKEIADKEVVAPLRPVIRQATEDDCAAHKQNIDEKPALTRNAQEIAAKNNVAMNIKEAEYVFDRSKVIIYYTAKERIDFKIIVKEFATFFKNRVELRQIYEQDEIELLNQYGCCGRKCCCTTFLKECAHANMKMAKVQNLSLNPQKLAGCCGKTMCCVKYEYSQYCQNQPQNQNQNNE